MGEWVPSEVMEVRLHWLVEKGLLPPKEVAGWMAAIGDVLPFQQPNEVVLFIDFHERGFMILMSDFFRGFLREYWGSSLIRICSGSVQGQDLQGVWL